MTEAERQALRDKHQMNNKRYCTFCYERLPFGIDRGLTGTSYPCDVIKVLDAWESELGLVIKAMTHEKFMQELTKAQEQIGLYNEGN